MDSYRAPSCSGSRPSIKISSIQEATIRAADSSKTSRLEDSLNKTKITELTTLDSEHLNFYNIFLEINQGDFQKICVMKIEAWPEDYQRAMLFIIPGLSFAFIKVVVDSMINVMNSEHAKEKEDVIFNLFDCAHRINTDINQNKQASLEVLEEKNHTIKKIISILVVCSMLCDFKKLNLDESDKNLLNRYGI
jgi:hypothetical protein